MTTLQTAIPDRKSITQKSAWQGRIVETCLDVSFLPDPATLVSFLVNALYLFGDHGIKAYGGASEGVAAELTRLGHKVAAGPWGREGRAGTGVRHRSGGAVTVNAAQSRHDRAMILARAFGSTEDGGDETDFTERLRAIRRDLRPGGLVCFYVFDRDRAWSLAGDRIVERNGGKARVRLGFDPRTGLLSARNTDEPRPGVPALPAGGRSAAVKAWNLAEIRALLRAAGLELERAYGDWDGRSPEAAGADTGRLIIVAAKPRRMRALKQRALKQRALKQRALKPIPPIDLRAPGRPGSHE